MKLKANNKEYEINLFENRTETVTVTVNEDSDLTSLKNAVEGAPELEYLDGEGKLIFKIYGAWKLKTIGGEGGFYKLTFKKSDEISARLAALEAENASLRNVLEEANAALLDTQEALAEIVEMGEAVENG